MNLSSTLHPAKLTRISFLAFPRVEIYTPLLPTEHSFFDRVIGSEPLRAYTEFRANQLGFYSGCWLLRAMELKGLVAFLLVNPPESRVDLSCLHEKFQRLGMIDIALYGFER